MIQESNFQAVSAFNVKARASSSFIALQETQQVEDINCSCPDPARLSLLHIVKAVSTREAEESELSAQDVRL